MFTEYILCLGHYEQFWIEYKEKYTTDNWENALSYCYNYGN